MPEVDPSSGPDLDGTVSWAALLAETRHLLEASGQVENARQEAKWILEEVTGATGAAFADALQQLATVRGVAKLDAMVARRCAGEPIQYVLGNWAFRSLDLLVDERALIPRPETEVIAGLAIDELDRCRPDGGGLVVDLGTGTGAIGLAVAVERPDVTVWLTDVSADALAVARANLAGLGVAGRSVRVAEGSWFDALPDELRGEVDVVVSNPPYVPTTTELPSSVADWEPETALRSGPDGLDDLRTIIAEASAWLAPGGALVLEMGDEQVEVVCAVLEKLGATAEAHRDLAGKQRGVVARWS